MNTPDLENHLKKLVPPRLPAGWKPGILHAALESRQRRHVRPAAERWAWGAIAATWLVIVGLRATTPSIPTADGPPISPAEFAAHRDQIRQYAALDILPPEPPAMPSRIRLEQEFILPARPRS
jgi:hypothetical protein